MILRDIIARLPHCEFFFEFAGKDYRSTGFCLIESIEDDEDDEVSLNEAKFIRFSFPEDSDESFDLDQEVKAEGSIITALTTENLKAFISVYVPIKLEDYL